VKKSKSWLWCVLMVVAVFAGGCSLFEEDCGESERETYGPIREAVARQDWGQVKVEAVRIKESGNDVWYALRTATDNRDVSKEEAREIVEVLVEVNPTFDDRFTAELIENLRLNPETVDEKFWRMLPVEARRGWLLEQMAGEVMPEIIKGRPASANARLGRLAAKLGGEPELPMMLAGSWAWSYWTTFFALGEGRLAVVHCGFVELETRKEQISSWRGSRYRDGMVVLVVNGKGRPEAYGVLPPYDDQLRWRGVSGAARSLVRVDARMNDLVRLTFDGVAFGPVANKEPWVQVMSPVTQSAEAAEGRVERWNPMVVATGAGKEGRVEIEDPNSPLAKVARANPGFGTVQAGYEQYITLQTSRGERIERRDTVILPIYWQDQETGKVGLKALLGEGGK
jgi:hypothetical protein